MKPWIGNCFGKPPMKLKYHSSKGEFCYESTKEYFNHKISKRYSQKIWDTLFLELVIEIDHGFIIFLERAMYPFLHVFPVASQYSLTNAEELKSLIKIENQIYQSRNVYDSLDPDIIWDEYEDEQSIDKEISNYNPLSTMFDDADYTDEDD